MAFELSVKAELLLNQNTVSPQLVLEIDGIDLIFGAVNVAHAVRIGVDELTIGEFIIGGLIDIPEARDYISLDGTSKSIRSQLIPDQGSSSSISSTKIELIDKDNELSKAFQIGNNVPDMLARKASIYMGFAEGDYPLDAIPVFFGIIDAISFPAGRVLISVSHPDKLKNFDIYSSIETSITSAIDASVTTIPLASVTGIFEDQDVLTSYLKIEDEIIKIGAISGTNATGCTRGTLNTVAATHDIDMEITTLYQFTDDPIDLALKLMLSGGPTYYEEDHFISNIVDDNIDLTVTNAILINAEDVEETIGIVVGDLVTITGSLVVANNVTDVAVTEIGRDGDTFFVVLNATLYLEHDSPAVFKVKTPYNVLPEGLKMIPNQVDVKEHQYLQTLYPTNFPTISPYVKETINGKDFVNKEILFPVGLYTIPRKGRSSLGYTSPPLATELLPVLDETNILNPEDLSVERSISKNFYNSTVWRFNEDSLEDKFLAGEITLSNDSLNRIASGNKPLKVDAKSLRDTAAHRQYIQQQSLRFLERYQFAPQFVRNVKLLPKDSFALEIGDVVAFGSTGLQLTNITDGDRDFEPTLMEIHNKTLDLVTYNTSIDLVDTAYGLSKKFAVISPASNVVSGSTTTEIVVTRSFSTKSTEQEKKKWLSYIGKNILVHSPDWTYEETTILNGFDDGNPDIMLVDALPSAPLSGYIVDIPTHDVADSLYKTMFCYFDPQEIVASGASNTVFNVVSATNFFVGSLIRIHNADFSLYSAEAFVTDVTVNTITVDTDLGFTPSSGQFIELIGFVEDSAIPYAIV